MMENYPLLTSLDEPSNSSPPKRLKSSLYSGDPAQEDQKISRDYQDETPVVSKSEVKQEAEETYVILEEPGKEINFPPEISTDSRETRRSRRLMQHEEEERRLIRIKEEETPMEIAIDSGGTRSSRRTRREVRYVEEEEYVRVKVEEIHPEMIIRETHPPSQATRARIRARRFSEPENIVLIENLLPHFDRLFGRLSSKTDSTTKSRIWKSIANAVTALGGARRDVQHCKKRYQDIKGNIRKKIAAHQAAVSSGDGAKVPLFLAESEELLRPYLANNARGLPGIYAAQHASTSVVDTGIYFLDFESEGPTQSESRSHRSQSEATQEHMEEDEELDQSQNESTYGPETSEQEGPEDRADSSPHGTSSTQPDVTEKSSVDRILRSHSVQHGRQNPPKAKKESFQEISASHLHRFTRLQTLHRRMLSRQMTQLHEDVTYLVNATEEQNNHLSGITNFMERIAVALETRNNLEDKRQASLEQINDQVKEKLWRHSLLRKKL